MKAEAPASRLSEKITGQNRIPTKRFSVEYVRVLVEELVFLCFHTFRHEIVTFRAKMILENTSDV